MSEYTASPAWPHGSLTPIFDDAFYVVGTNEVHHDGVDLRTSRTMLVLRDKHELTLLNSVRLDAGGLAQLDALGRVSHVVRLGAFHGRDDPFYRDRYGATLWALPGSEQVDGRDADRALEERAELPIPDARLLVFWSARHPEAALWLPRAGGVLVTCDAVQNWTEVDRFFSPSTGELFQRQGLIRPANIPSTWLEACQPSREDFDRLLTLPFVHLVSAHGEPLLHRAHEAVAASVARVFTRD